MVKVITVRAQGGEETNSVWKKRRGLIFTSSLQNAGNLQVLHHFVNFIIFYVDMANKVNALRVTCPKSQTKSYEMWN